MENIIEENLTEKEVIISTDPERLHKVLVVTFEITKKILF